MQGLLLAGISALMVSVFISQVKSMDRNKVYLIKKRSIEQIPEALHILRNFLSPELTLYERCEKYGVLLDKIKSSPIDQFWIADLGLERSDLVHKKVAKIDLNSLRNSYMTAIEKSREGPIDFPMFEVYDCLKSQFSNTDANARSFLNDKSLREAMEQFESITNQPLSFLIDKQTVHPNLILDKLQPAVYKTAMAIFIDDASLVERKFPLPAPLQRIAEPELQQTASSQQFHEPVLTYWPSRASTSDSIASNSRSGGYEPYDNRYAGWNPTPVVHNNAKEYAASLTPELVNLLKGAGLGPDDVKHFSKLPTVLNLLHSNIPDGASQDNRCRAYSEAMTLGTADANEIGVQRIIGQMALYDPTEPFVPDEESLQNFLWALEKLRPEYLGIKVWFALADCTASWFVTHQAARDFIESDAVEDFMKQVVADAQTKTREAAMLAGFLEQQPEQETAQAPPIERVTSSPNAPLPSNQARQSSSPTDTPSPISSPVSPLVLPPLSHMIVPRHLPSVLPMRPSLVLLPPGSYVQSPPISAIPSPILSPMQPPPASPSVSPRAAPSASRNLHRLSSFGQNGGL